MRDPAYQPMRGMSGSQLWWLKGMREDHWVLGAFILAGLLAINLTLNLWQWYFSQPYLTDYQHQAGILLRHFVNGSDVFCDWSCDVVGTVLCVCVLPTNAVVA
jgi:hypothetical protein